MFLALDALFPLPMPDTDHSFAVAVVAEDGTPLRSFPDDRGVWRYPATLKDVAPVYLEALITYEDRWFYYHPGVNPWALIRAAVNYIRYGQVVTGGSTLTMQVARILDPHGRTIPGKLKQIFRAFQLELHCSKAEILTIYLNFAPFGGPVEGVQAASYTYLGKSAGELSHAEAALLAVLPQSPSRLRPDRRADLAAKARDKVLQRMLSAGVWSTDIVKEARIEKVAWRFEARPMLAPLLAQHLKSMAGPASPIRTTIDTGWQQIVTDQVQQYIQTMPARTSAAAMVVDNTKMSVKAYVGSADFLDDSRYGHVDMIRAYRSPGSLLKPFLYAFALEEGLIHSESLLVDAPTSFDGYRPVNFSEGFSGPVSAGEALNRSLNIPAVDLSDRLGVNFFDARLKQGGLTLRYPRNGTPNLSMILGGVGATLEELVGAYAALARQGLAGKPRYTLGSPLQEKRMMSAGAAYIIRKIMQENPRPDRSFQSRGTGREVAWKTGTSYGYRDAWAIGVTDNYTVGVWIGRPDGTPSPGQYGRATAAPLLFRLIDSLPRRSTSVSPAPASVSRVEICWPLGIPPRGPEDGNCHQRRTAWVLNGAVPPTFSDRLDQHWLSNPASIMVNPQTGLRVDADCPVSNPVEIKVARWPKATWPWLSPRMRQASRVPGLDALCRRPVSLTPDIIKIIDLQPGSLLRPQGAATELPTIALQATGGRGRLFWLLNGELIAESDPGQIRYYQFQRPGRYRLVVMDLAGNFDDVEFTVLKGQTSS